MKNRDKNWKISKENIEIIDTNGFLNGEFVIDFENEPEEWEAAFYWALQYGADLEVVEPVRLRNRVRDMILDIRERYEK